MTETKGKGIFSKSKSFIARGEHIVYHDAHGQHKLPNRWILHAAFLL